MNTQGQTMARNNGTNKLNDLMVKNLKTKGKYTDGGGMYLLIKANGGKYWHMDYYRPITKKRNTLALGVYGEVSLAQARQKRDYYRALLADNIDPATAKQHQQEQAKIDLSNTFDKYAQQWLEHRKLERKVDKETVRKLNKDILPYIGHLPIKQITLADLEQTVGRLIERNALESARRVKSILKMILEYAQRKGIIQHNPAILLQTPVPKKGHHPAITTEKELPDLLKAIWGYNDQPRRQRLTGLALQFCVYIFQRPNEIRYLTWQDVDMEKRLIFITASKTHTQHIIPLSEQAFNILMEVKALGKTSPYMFPSIKSHAKEPVISENTLGDALKTLGYTSKQTIHGFRATARTLLEEELGINPAIIEMQLAHTVKDHNGTAYNRTKFIKQRIHIMQTWADYIDALRTGEDVSHFKPE